MVFRLVYLVFLVLTLLPKVICVCVFWTGATGLRLQHVGLWSQEAIEQGPLG